MNALLNSGDDLFGWVLQTTWQASILAILIILAQSLLRHRLSAGWRYGLWLLVVARLLLPVAPQTAWSIFNVAKFPLRLAPVETGALPSTSFANSVSPLMAGAAAEAKPVLQSPSAVPGAADHRGQVHVAMLTGTARENPARPPVLDWRRAALLVWLLGACIFAARLLWSNVRFWLRVAAEPAVTNEPARRQLDECRSELGIGRAVALIETEAVESPSVHGLWRKRLLLPKGIFDRFSAEQVRCIFLHELAHLKRRDLEVNCLASALQALHWFNPLLWFGFGRMRADREMACDALALAHLGKAPAETYGETIIKVVEDLVRPPRARGLLALSEDKRQLKERMRMIAAFRGRPGVSVWALTLVAGIAVVGLTDAQPGGTPFVQLSPATAPATTAVEIAPPATADLSQNILGTWELVSTKTPPATEFTDYPKEHRRVKLISQVGPGPQAYQVTGVVRFEGLSDLSLTNSQRWEVPFKVEVKGRRWRIDLPPSERHPDDSRAYFYDGQAMYTLHAFPGLVEKARLAGKTVADNVAYSGIQELPFPRNLTCLEGSLIWLAYCSEEQFAKATPEQFVPVFGYGGGPEIFDSKPAEPQRTYWALSTQRPRVPTKFTGLLTFPAWFLDRMQAANMQPPSGLLTNVAYAVQSWTNVGMLHLPLVASVTLFKVKSWRPGIEMTPNLAMQVVVSNLSVGIAPSLTEPPSMTFISTIEDERSGTRGVGSNWIIRGKSLRPSLPQVSKRSKP